MSSYESLAASYDDLTWDVQYESRADFIESLLRRSRIDVRVMLDLACGTGTMTNLFTERGYEMIAADASADMLAAAREKASALHGEPPIFLQQSMPRLDLYGTVDAAICCLDSLNYLTDPRDVRRTFERLHLFIAPGGMLVFDVITPHRLESLDGEVFLDEQDDVYCVWRADYQKRSRIITYWMDIFRREGDAWQRSGEEHRERAYTVEELSEWLRAAGFTAIRTYGDQKHRAPSATEERIYFSCIRGK